MKSGDSWPLVLVRRRPSLALYTLEWRSARVLLGTTYLLEGFVRVQTRAGVPREQTALIFGDSRISHSEPSVCATLALLVGRVLRGAGLRECREASPVRSSSCGRSAAIRTRRLERFGWGSRRRVGSRLRVYSIGTVRGGTRAGPLAASIAVVRGRGTMRSDVFGSITLIGRSSGPRSCKPKRPIAPKIWGHVPDIWADWWRDS